MTVIEVYADVACPFTHLGLRRFVAARAVRERFDVTLWVRAWPLEIVNGTPLDAGLIAEEVDDLRDQVAPTLFAGFTVSAFPASSLPALALAAAAYDVDLATGERVSLALRDLLFEEGTDIADPAVLTRISAVHDLDVGAAHAQRVLDDRTEGVARGVLGSPHFFTPSGGFFCPALDIHRDPAGHLSISADPAGFDEFIASCFG